MDTNQGAPARISAFHYEVCRLRFERGLTQREIAAKLGVSRNQIQKAIRDWNVHEQYYTKQHTFFRIASDLNLTVKTLRGIFRKHGWQMRVQTERKKLSNGEIRKLHYE